MKLFSHDSSGGLLEDERLQSPFFHFLNSFSDAALGDIAQATVMVHVLIGKEKFICAKEKFEVAVKSVGKFNYGIQMKGYFLYFHFLFSFKKVKIQR
jgi:hypothetical protein